MHLTPNDYRFFIAREIQALADRWDAEGLVFPSVATIRAVNAGVDALIADAKAREAREHNRRAA